MKIIISIILLVVFGCGSTSTKKENKSLNANKNERYIYVDVKSSSLISIKNDSYAPKSFANENEIYIKTAALIIRSKENDKTPFQLLREICIIKKGSIACRVLGYFYDDQEEIEEASKYYTKACYLNDHHSCRLGGGHYLFRLKKYKMAKKVFKYSCEKSNNRDSCFNLAHIHLYKIFNPKEGVKLFGDLCSKKRDNQSCIELAYFFRNQASNQEKEKAKKSLYKSSLSLFSLLCLGENDGIACIQASNIAKKINEKHDKYDLKGCSLGEKELCK